MKKVILFLTILLVLLSSGCDDKIFKRISESISLAFEVENNLGNRNISVSFKFDDGVKCVLIKNKGIEYEIYKNGEDAESINENIVNPIAEALRTGGRNITGDLLAYGVPLERFSGDFLQNKIFLSDSAVEQYFSDEKSESFTTQFEFNEKGNVNAQFILIIKDGESIYALYFDGKINAEFFEGESALFDRVDPDAAYSYKEKSLAFLSTFWDTEELYSDFKNNLAGFYDLPKMAENTLRTTMLADTELDACQTEFQESFAKHFNFHKENVEENYGLRRMFSDLGSNSFDSLYGILRNDYIFAYSLYCFKNNKPLLSYIIEKDLQRDIDHDKMEVYDFNYRNYTPFNETTDGKGLVEAALRYLTWGVEYTPSSTINSSFSSVQTERNDVYKNFRDLVNTWIGESGGDRENNYLPAGREVKKYSASHLIDIPEVNSKTHIITGDFKSNSFRIFGAKKEGAENVVIKHVDLWTADNIAWRDSIIKNAVIKSSADNPGDSAILYNQNIFTDAANEVLTLRSGDDDTVEVGYEFNQIETVQGIILAYKKRNNGDFDNSKAKYMKVFLKSNGQWQENSVPIRELNFDETGGGTFWAPNNNNNGYTITEDFFGITPAQEGVAYCYIILNQKALCEGIKVEYKYDVDTAYTINMLEMMVFNGNPINYIPNAGGLFSNIFSENPYYKEGDDADDDIKITSDSIDMKFDFTGNTKYPLQTVVVWEDPDGTADSAVDGYLALGSSELDLEYLKPYNVQQVVDGASVTLSTPFWKKAGAVKKVYLGNPLPYTPFGIDTPRTFAYKMKAQFSAKFEYRLFTKDPFEAERIINGPTFFAQDSAGYENYNEGYVIEKDLLTSSWFSRNAEGVILSNMGNIDQMVHKPFLPGKVINSKEGYTTNTSGPYHVDKIAGVDSIGILMGSLSMLPDTVTVDSYINKNTASNVGHYSNMSPSRVLPGMDDSGQPVFYAKKGNSFLDGDYRFTQADIERSTVLVPDLGLIQKGDLLVRYNNDFGDLKDLHVGIVVDFDTNFLGGPGGRSDARIKDFMNSVVVLSVRRGFQMVALGTWGNPENSFGGFTSAPEKYQLRRLLKKRLDIQEPLPGSADPWELVKEIPKKYYTEYPGKNEVASYDSTYVTTYRYSEADGVGNDGDGITFANQNEFIEYQLRKLRQGELGISREDSDGNYNVVGQNRFYYKFLPPSVFKGEYASTLPLTHPATNKMRVTCTTGFRALQGAYGSLTARVGTHKGIDISNGGMDRGGVLFQAPEDGLFYIFNSETPGYVNGQIRLPDGSSLSTFAAYPNTSYGSVGVLITNPSKPEDGRVYLFCHMESMTTTNAQLPNNTAVDTQLENRRNFYINTFGIEDFPDTPENGITVWAGQDIGHVGGAPKFWTHLHLEVFEHFEKVYWTEDGDDGWQRIDAVSLFDRPEWIDHEATKEYLGDTAVYLNQEYIDIINEDNPKRSESVLGDWSLWDRNIDSFYVP